jgi:DNA repair protein RadC
MENQVRNLSEDEKSSTIDLAIAILRGRHRRGRRLESTLDTERYLTLTLAENKNEVFGVLFLDNRHRILSMDELFHGTFDGTSVHPRVIAQRALELNAAAAILYHNHPSGVSEPSLADRSVTSRIKDALSLFDVRVLDHFIIAAEGNTSFAAKGLL